MNLKTDIKKVISYCLVTALMIFGFLLIPVKVSAEEPVVDTNILLGKLPTSNSTHQIVTGDSTVPQVQILNPDAATDGEKSGSSNDEQNTKIIAGEETGGADNGYSGWDHVYLQYDFGKSREVKQIKLYRNTYDNAVSTFKDVKVELSADKDFTNSKIVYDTADYEETVDTKGQAQVISLTEPLNAQYIRIWGKGHYVQNTNSSWKGYSNGVLFNEIEVIAPVSESELPEAPPQEVTRNIALGKIPYVYGLEPTNIAAITDGKANDNYAVHNSKGNRWLQFEYKNVYKIKEIKFKLEEGTYKSVKVSISSKPDNPGQTVFEEKNWTQTPDMQVITLDQAVSGKDIRFTVNKDDNGPAKYSEIEIWAAGKSYDESRPEYVDPVSKYDTLVWSDEFNGNQVDETKWNIIDGMANDGAIYNRDAVSIQNDGENSYLSINSKNYGTTENLINAVGWDQYGSQTLGSHVTWSSGRLESKNKFSFQFGRMKVRAKVNDSKGIWPAIWMLCQDETGHDEIDVLEYLGQDPWTAWTTNHFGILDKNKSSQGAANKNYEAWSQAFHVYEVEWDPESITFFIDGVQVFKTSAAKDDGRDGMHTRPMFPILETQVGDGWVGPVDYNKQETKQDSNFLIDYVRVYQTENQPVTRFDDLTTLEQTTGKGTDGSDYFISTDSHTDSLLKLTDGDKACEDKDNFYYGGQPRYETSRIAVKEGAKEQSLVYHIPGVKDVHLTTYYQTLSDKSEWSQAAGANKGFSIRKYLQDNKNIDFQVFCSKDGKTWERFHDLKVVDNFIEAHPGYARTTFDAYSLPAGTNYVKVLFPEYEGVNYALDSGAVKPVLNTDIQLAKVTFLQEKQKANVDTGELETAISEAEKIQKDLYTAESYKVLQDAVSAGKDILNSQDITEQKVTDAVNAIQTAIQGLVKVPQIPDIPDVPDTPVVPDIPDVPDIPQKPDTSVKIADKNNTGVIVEAGKGILPDNTELAVTIKESGAEYDLAKKALADAFDKFTLYDINLNVNGNKVEPFGTVKVKIPLPAGYNGNKSKVLYINEQGLKEELSSTVEGKFIVFNTNHFSLYALAEQRTDTAQAKDEGKANNIKLDKEKSTPKTGDETYGVFILTMLLLSMGALGACIVYKRAYKRA